MKELGPETYKCLQDREASPVSTDESPDPIVVEESDDLMDVDDPDDPRESMDVEESADRADVAVQDTVECPFLAEDEADELGDVTRAGTLPFLEKLRTPHLQYLHNVKENLLTGVLEFLPLVYRQKGMAPKSKKEWRTAATEFSKGHT